MRQHKSKSGPENLLRPLQVQKLTKNLRLLNIYVKVLCFSCIAHGSKTYGMGRRLATYHSTHYLTFRKQGLKKIDTFTLKRRRVTIFICQSSPQLSLFTWFTLVPFRVAFYFALGKHPRGLFGGISARLSALNDVCHRNIRAHQEVNTGVFKWAVNEMI